MTAVGSPASAASAPAPAAATVEPVPSPVSVAAESFAAAAAAAAPARRASCRARPSAVTVAWIARMVGQSWVRAIMPMPSSSWRTHIRRDSRALATRAVASGSNRATSAVTSPMNCPTVIRFALVSARRPIASNAASSSTSRVRSTSTAQWPWLISPARSAAAKPGKTVASARATSIALPAAHREVLRATATSCSRRISGRYAPLLTGPASATSVLACMAATNAAIRSSACRCSSRSSSSGSPAGSIDSSSIRSAACTGPDNRASSSASPVAGSETAAASSSADHSALSSAVVQPSRRSSTATQPCSPGTRSSSTRTTSPSTRARSPSTARPSSRGVRSPSAGTQSPSCGAAPSGTGSFTMASFSHWCTR